MPEAPYPTTTRVVCSNLIVDTQGVLLVRESKPSALDRWSLPAGRLESGESLIEGAVREALEETGLVVETRRLLGIYHCPLTLEGGSAINFVFESVVVGGEIQTTAEHPEVVFMARVQVDALLAAHQIRGSHVALALAAYDAGESVDLASITEVAASAPPLPSTS